MENNMEVVIIGRAIGNAEGWDDMGDHMVIFYDFKPLDGLSIPSGDLHVDFEHGYIFTTDDAGNDLIRLDMIEILKNVPRKE